MGNNKDSDIVAAIDGIMFSLNAVFTERNVMDALDDIGTALERIADSLARIDEAVGGPWPAALAKAMEDERR